MSSERTQKHKAMARWAVELLTDRPLMTYAERRQAVRDKFGIGKGAAERVISAANEMFDEHFDKFRANASRWVWDQRVAAYQRNLRDAEQWRAEAQLATAARDIERLMRVAQRAEMIADRNMGDLLDRFDVGKTIKIRLTLGADQGEATLPPLTTEQLLLLEKIDGQGMQLGDGADASLADVEDADFVDIDASMLPDE